MKGEAGLCINYKSKQKKREMEKMSSSYKILCVEIMYGFTRERRPRHNIVSTSKNHDQAPVLSKVFSHGVGEVEVWGVWLRRRMSSVSES